MNRLYPTVRRSLLAIVCTASLQTLIAQPVINSVSPAAGPAGLQVVIKGANFNPTPTLNEVFFGVAPAPVMKASTDSLLVRVPQGANFQELSVYTGGLTGYYWARPPFRKTFGKGGVAFTAGSFAQYSSFFPVDGGSLAIAEVSGDQNADIITGGLNTNGVVVGKRGFSVLGNTSVSGTVSFSTKHFYAGYVPFFTSMADMNGDGKADVVAWDTTILGNNEIAVYPNNGSPGTVSFGSGTHISYGSGFTGVPIKMVVRDFDGDGKPDVLTTHNVVASNTTTYFTFLRNTSSGGTVSLQQLPDMAAQSWYGVEPSVSNYIVADLDRDGKPDIVAMQSNGFYFYRNTSVPGTISWAPSYFLSYFAPGTQISDLAAADLDGDGFPELIYLVLAGSSYQLDAMWNDGQPGPTFYSPHAFATGNGAARLAVGDLDGDGKPELVVSNKTDGTVGVYRNTCTPVQGMSDIFFDAPVMYSTGPGTSGLNEANDLEIVDMDGDGRPDIVAALPDGTGNVVVLRNLLPYASAPTVTAVTPMTGTAGATVGIKGTNFTGALTLNFGDVPAGSYTVNSDDSITAILGNGGTGSVVLIAPGGSDTVQGFVYTDEPPPAVTSFTPDSVGYYGSITIKGKHFTNLVSATAGGQPLSNLTLVNDSTVTGYVTAAASSYVAVFTTAGADSLGGFTYIAPQPVVIYFAPTSGRPADTIAVKGYHLIGATQVSFGGVPASYFHVLNDSMLIAVVGHGASGVVSVSHGSVSGSRSGFTFISPAPAINSFSPASGKQGDSVTIKGYYFTGASTVSFGGTNAGAYSVKNDSTVLAVVGAGSTGVVTVTTAQGSGSSSAQFTFGVTPPPDTTAPAPPSDTTSPAPPPSDSTSPAPPDTTAPAPPSDTTSPAPPPPSDSTAPAPPPSDTTLSAPPPPSDSTAPAPPDTTAKPTVFGLQGFTVSLSAGEAVLKWQTTNDKSIESYTLQEGSDSTQLDILARITPQHKDSANYVYQDATLRTGVVWYRLLAVDTSNRQLYSWTAKLSFPEANATGNAYPNPAANGMLQVMVPSSTLPSQFELADMAGRVLLAVPVSPGTLQVQINVGTINTGTYQLSWSNGIQRTVQTVLVVKR
ncbi:MAG TPA: FG-GAP-like repeat-containing protein [Puia sp.]|nr:FG-GAP-like repeat-containing protein [Puia sp.]